MLTKALEYSKSQRSKHLQCLSNWLRIPSISTDQNHADDVRRAAEFARRVLQDMGMTRAEIRPTSGHPIVYAEWLGNRPAETASDADNGALTKTLLIYGHFDVQPVDPLELWNHPPFEPLIANDNIYARGASDDKGQAFAVLCALEAYLKSAGQLPVNVKVLLEGEEEVSSPNLFPYIRQHRDELCADSVLIADQDMLSPQHPVIMLGTRGQVYLELQVRGPARDLHSGTFGGSVDNPLNVLVRMLAQLQDATSRRILIPGFYDRVEALSDQDRQQIAQVPITDEMGLLLTGAPQLAGESGFSLAERVSVRPTLEIHGIFGGYTGEGKKTIIPSRATAKLGMRLVPKQLPEEIACLTEKYLRQLCPPTVEMEIRQLGVAHPVKLDFRSPPIQAAATAYQLGFGHPPVYLRGGGSLPIVHEMIQSLSKESSPLPVVMIGFGLPDDCTHAPNEKLSLSNFYNGIDTVIHYLDQLGRSQTSE